jgi:hypothetical protein
VKRPAGPNLPEAALVVTDDGPALLVTGPGGVERGTLLVTKAPSGRSRVVGYRDEPPRGADSRGNVRAPAPRSRPREHRAAGASDSGGGSRDGDSGDRPPPPDDLARDERAPRPAPALVLRLPLEGRLTARVEGPPGNLRLDDWLRSSRVLLELARFALDLHEALIRVDEEVDQ